MSKDINRVVLKGRVVAKPVMRYMPSGDPVCTFALVTSYGNHDEFHKLVGYYDNAEQAVKEFDKGDTIYFEGYIKTRQFQTEEDKKLNRKPRSVLEIVADQWTLVKKSGSGNRDLAKQENPENAPISGPEETDGDVSENAAPLSFL